MHHGYAAQPGRGDEAGQVGGRSPTDGHDGIGAGEAGPSEHAPQPGGHVGGLRRLTVGDRGRSVPRNHCPATTPRTASTVRRSRPAGWTTSTRRTVVAERRRELAEQPGADHDVVRRGAGADGDPAWAHRAELPPAWADGQRLLDLLRPPRPESARPVSTRMVASRSYVGRRASISADHCAAG